MVTKISAYIKKMPIVYLFIIGRNSFIISGTTSREEIILIIFGTILRKIDIY